MTLEHKCIGRYRLSEKSEKATMDWLSKSTIANNQSNIQSLKDLILGMYGNNGHYTSPEESVLIEKLRNNEEAVDIVLVTIFRWFGSAVGQDSLKEL